MQLELLAQTMFRFARRQKAFLLSTKGEIVAPRRSHAMLAKAIAIMIQTALGL
jgi:hypothetical protein